MRCALAPETLLVREGKESDLPPVAAIQAACPQAAQWLVQHYLAHDFLVAEDSSGVAGFVVARHVAPDESEILNLAVVSRSRRRGIARSLLEGVAERHPGALFLEVRASNQAARSFYQAFGFQEVGIREEYYENPLESAVVMKFHSCYCHK
jgi:[ribosomal protein S18]-alanine N-acetyltransferase